MKYLFFSLILSLLGVACWASGNPELFSCEDFHGAYPPGTRLSIETYQGSELVGVSEGIIIKTLPGGYGTPERPLFLCHGYAQKWKDKQNVWHTRYDRSAVGLYVKLLADGILVEGWLLTSGEILTPEGALADCDPKPT